MKVVIGTNEDNRVYVKVESEGLTPLSLIGLLEVAKDIVLGNNTSFKHDDVEESE